MKLAGLLMVDMNEEYLWQFDKTSGYIMLLHEVLTKKNTVGFYRLYVKKEEDVG